MSSMRQLTLGPIQHPVRGLLHGTAACVAVAGLWYLSNLRVGGGLLLSLVVYGTALVLMFTVSATYHSVPWRPRAKRLLQKLDHTFIYVLVAATATPLMVATLDGVFVYVNLIAMWTLVALGMMREFWPATRRPWLLGLQVLMVTMALGPLLLAMDRMEPIVLALTLVGGGVYLGGLVMFVRSRPRLLPGIFSHHELFHVLVVIASASHFFAVWHSVTPG
jgi:hemolysin III